MRGRIGYIPLWRKTLDNNIYRHDHTAWRVFETLLLLANRRTRRWEGGRKQLAEYATLKEGTTYSALLRLQKAKMITLDSNTRYSKIHICNWDKHQVSVNSPVNNRATTGQQQGNTLTISREVENKEILSKDNMVTYGNPEINEMFTYWQETTGLPITAKQQANRRACNNLLKKHGLDNLKRLVDGVAQSQNDQYAPRIADFAQLQSKTNELLVWGKKLTKRKAVEL